jgi:hypothetical protein
MIFMKSRLLIYILGILFCLLPVKSWAQSEHHADFTQVLLADSAESQESPDFWMNTAYSLTGSAFANGALVLVLAALDLGLQTFNPESQSLQNQVGILAVLPILSGFATAEFMHLNPRSTPDSAYGSMIGSTIASLVSLGLMMTLALLFPQENLANTYWTILPSAFISTVLLQSFGAAWGNQIDQTIHLQTNQQGMHLVYQWRF